MIDAVTLPVRFKGPEAFQSQQRKEGQRYQILPFRFDRFDSNRYILTNDAGEYYLLGRADLVTLVKGGLEKGTPLYGDLLARHFLYDDDSDAAFDLLAAKVRRRYEKVRQFTGLHIFVVTLRCDYSCPYCQVSRQTEDKKKFDMDEETAVAALSFVFKSPSQSIKIEFQGGEPLLNFPMIRFIVEKAEEINKREKRDLAFVIATNLSFVDDTVLDYCEEHHIVFSTSLDGPQELHDRNRPRPGKNGHSITRDNILKIQRRLGPDSVSALMTTTERSLSRPREIVDEYIDAGFQSIFLRPLSPYGFAIKTRQMERYDFERFFTFYKEAIDYILEINRAGLPFVEAYSSIVLTKVFSGKPTAYVDLQSPSGMVTGALVYNYDGGVYVSDEGRMLAEMGDDTFRVGDVLSSSYEEVLLNPVFHAALEESLIEGAPECYECAFQPYCGSDPVYHYATQGDWVGHKAFSAFCARTKSVTRYLLQKIEERPENREILLGWVRS